MDKKEKVIEIVKQALDVDKVIIEYTPYSMMGAFCYRYHIVRGDGFGVIHHIPINDFESLTPLKVAEVMISNYSETVRSVEREDDIDLSFSSKGIKELERGGIKVGNTVELKYESSESNGDKLRDFTLGQWREITKEWSNQEDGAWLKESEGNTEAANSTNINELLKAHTPEDIAKKLSYIFDIGLDEALRMVNNCIEWSENTETPNLWGNTEIKYDTDIPVKVTDSNGDPVDCEAKVKTDKSGRFARIEVMPSHNIGVGQTITVTGSWIELADGEIAVNRVIPGAKVLQDAEPENIKDINIPEIDLSMDHKMGLGK